MDWVEVIKSVYKTLKEKGHHDIAFEIGQEHTKGGSPDEMFIYLVAKLRSIKRERPDIYLLIKEETEWMITCAKIHKFIDERDE